MTKHQEYNNISSESSKNTQITNFFRGRGGLKTIFDDMILKGEEISLIGYNDLKGYEEEFERFNQRRKEENISIRRVIPKTFKGKLKETFNCKIKYISDKYCDNTYLAVYANKIAIIQWGEELLTISIKVVELTQNLREYFEFLWNIAKK